MKILRAVLALLTIAWGGTCEAQTSQVMAPSYWGMHISAPSSFPFPVDDFGVFRTHDVYPGVYWTNINPSSGTFDFTNVDSLLSVMNGHGITDIVFTLGSYIPSWTTQPGVGNTATWAAYVNAIVSRYCCTRIKYWEIWNEPNAPSFWSGTNADMVAVAQAAYNIIHAAGGIVVGPSPQGENAFSWLSGYLAAGGAPYQDIMGVHGYISTGGPELIVTSIANYRAVMATYGISAKPIWDTEFGWGDTTSPYGDTLLRQSQWVARSLILKGSNLVGIQRGYWYMWDNVGGFGPLYDRVNNILLQPGIVYQTMWNWLVNRAASCSANGTLYSCSLTNSDSAMIYWTSSGTQTVSLPPNIAYTNATDIFGNVTTISGNQITASETPLMVSGKGGALFCGVQSAPPC